MNLPDEATTASGPVEVVQRNGLFIAGLTAAVLDAITVTFAVPEYRNLFQGLGPDLPLVTRIAVNYYHGIWLLPLMVIAARFAWPVIRLRSVVSCIVAFAGSFASTVMLIFALYLPIFRLGDAV